MPAQEHGAADDQQIHVLASLDYSSTVNEL
jgi:hypothetical protein